MEVSIFLLLQVKRERDIWIPVLPVARTNIIAPLVKCDYKSRKR